MSAHYGAPGFRRPQLATPSYPASPQGSSTTAHSQGTPVLRRKALTVAVATLCAPALAALALAALAATGGGDRAAMGSLAGSEGLRGTTTPAVSSPPATRDTEHPWTKKGTDSGGMPERHVQRHPSSRAPSRAPTPVHHPAPTHAPKVAPAPRAQVSPPTLPAPSPNTPGAPSASNTTSGTPDTSGSASDTSSSTSDSQHGGGTADGYDAYPAGG
jgi:hypothetical protein